tara:strand:- start:646 stop:1512 length:867 start_codon:yes stop_codon:yes gene_type:complete
MPIQQMLLGAVGGGAEVVGQQEFTTPGTYTFTVPPGVTSVSVVCIGAGGCGGAYGAGGGSLAYKNNIAVTPGATHTVVVGQTNTTTQANGNVLSQETAGSSSVLGTEAYGGYGGNVAKPGSPGIGVNYDGGGEGGGRSSDFYQSGIGYKAGSGGGAGGYSGSGGDAGYGVASGNNGSGGGGGGGASGPSSDSCGGGGVGIYGAGSNGSGATSVYNGGTGNGGGGSGGTDGSLRDPHPIVGGDTGGGLYGGGGGGGNKKAPSLGSSGGAVRIIWPGDQRQFPSTRTTDE